MERSDGCRDEIWGTWEELLLASAVEHYGPSDWGSIAAALAERTRHVFTAELCERRYGELCHRFKGEAREIDGVGAGDPFAVPWLEELRRLRVVELRRKIQEYDDSIASLQLKVKRLTEERERSRSLREGEDSGTEAREPEESNRKSNGHLPEVAADGERSGRSCNESNSPEPKEEEGQTREPEKAEEELEKGSQPPRADLVTVGDDKATAEGSCNGSSETVVVGKGAEAAAAAGDADEPNTQQAVSGESMAESFGEDAAKESSDVQSSVSPSRRRKRDGRRKPRPAAATASGGYSEGDSPEARVDSSCKSQPLVVVLQIIRSNKHGSVFESRVDSQDSARYRSLIRQHMDLRTVGKKLEEGASSYTPTEFFRDLFLICANAAVFFPRDSSEHSAATHLRKLVKANFAPFNRKKPSSLPAPHQAPESTAFTPLQAPPPPPWQPAVSSIKSESEVHTSLLDKVAPNPPLSVCRKRSSLAAKAVTAAKATKEDAAHVPVEEKPKSELEKELEKTEKVAMKEKPVARGLRTTKTRGPSTKKPTLPGGTDLNPRTEPEGKEDNATEQLKIPAEKKAEVAATPPSVTVAKKRSAASFLNRLRGTGSGSPLGSGEKNPTPMPAGKSLEGVGTKGGGEHKKGSGKEERRKEKQEMGRRSVGRPPKRPSPTTQPSAKRARETDGPPPVPGKKRRR